MAFPLVLLLVMDSHSPGGRSPEVPVTGQPLGLCRWQVPLTGVRDLQEGGCKAEAQRLCAAHCTRARAAGRAGAQAAGHMCAGEKHSSGPLLADTLRTGGSADSSRPCEEPPQQLRKAPSASLAGAVASAGHSLTAGDRGLGASGSLPTATLQTFVGGADGGGSVPAPGQPARPHLLPGGQAQR